MRRAFPLQLPLQTPLLKLLQLVLLLTAVFGAPAARATDEPATVMLHNRRIVDFRVPLGGDTPAQRAAMAQEALRAVAERGGPFVLRPVPAGPALRFEVDGTVVFFLLPEDLGGAERHGQLDAAAQKVSTRLAQALRESREMRDPRALATAAAQSLAVTAAAALALWVAWWLRGHADRRLAAVAPAASPRRASAFDGLGRRLLRAGLALLAWLATLLVLDLWAADVLQRFAYTRPWGEASTAWLANLLGRVALGIAGAVPGLATAVLIFVLARLAVRAHHALMRRVERGDLHLGGLDADTAGPTRRVVTVLIWLFAVALAYPHLPGANSESFKGVSVLAGLMLSLGASGVVGQAVAGLTLMYARALRVGEYVKIGETEGTVTELGLFTTRVHTGMGEEVSLPNALVVSLPVRNFSRLVGDGRFVLHTAVTIGYATPWRQVHALLLEAARRTAGVAQEPAPYVIQTALSDFYVEYRLCCQASRSAPTRRAEAMNALHANIQDVFNENGVQIMSPHYLGDPPAPQVVPEGPWTGPSGAPLSPMPPRAGGAD